MSTIGDERVVEGFLYFPKSIRGRIKWLTLAKWTEKYKGLVYISSGDMMECGGYDEKWEATGWL